MNLFFHGLLSLAVMATPVLAQDLRHPSSLNSFCVDPERDTLCPDFPNDQIDFSDKFVYMFINVATQTPFDIFSWQAFVSLNWPETGRPPADLDSNWQTFSRREEVFANDLAVEHCSEYAPDADVITSSLLQADGNALIDQNGNFIVYETRMNAVAEDYVRDNALDTVAGQFAANELPVSFPQGRLGDDQAPASVLIKASWRILTPEVDPSQYVVRKGLIYVPASHSASGKDMCIRERLGLVGMHIVSRVHSGNGDEWLWSTFEHRLTAPTAGNTRRINAIFSNDLFPGGCSAPEQDNRLDYIFYNPDCPDCRPNQPPDANVLWAASPPYSRAPDTPGTSPSQIVRCWTVFEGTEELNEIWQAELAGTSLANYGLISTQWRGADISPMFEHGEVPRFLTNTTMESYLQSDSEGTCMGCHAAAQTAAGADGNFTFLFRSARDE